MAREYWSWINGQYANDSHIIAFSGAILHGYGAFETLYYNAGKIHYFPEHVERLQQAADFYDLSLAISEVEIETIITDLIARNELTEARIRITLTAKSNDYSALPIPSDIQITAHPYERIEKNVSLVSEPAQKFGCPLQSHKSTSYASYILAKKYAQKNGADDTLLRDAPGNYIECSASNIFFAKNGNWFTPDLTSYGLPGIQRKAVLSAMKRLQIPCSTLPVKELDFDFGFICNSLIGINVIQRVDALKFNTQQKADLDQLQDIRALI